MENTIGTVQIADDVVAIIAGASLLLKSKKK